MTKRSFTKYPSSYVKATTISDEELAYITSHPSEYMTPEQVKIIDKIKNNNSVIAHAMNILMHNFLLKAKYLEWLSPHYKWV